MGYSVKILQKNPETTDTTTVKMFFDNGQSHRSIEKYDNQELNKSINKKFLTR